MVYSGYDKKKLIILRAVLILIGGAVGGTALWQYFVAYPAAMRQELQIVMIVVSAVVLAAILGLSAKPFYRLGVSIGRQFASVYRLLGARGVVAVVCGLAAAGIIGYVFDVTVRGAITILAVRVLADALVIIVFSALCSYGFTKWMAASDAEEELAPLEPRGKTVGYILGASCFFDDRVFTAARALYNVKTSEATFRALWKHGDRDALERFRLLTESDAVAVVKCSKEFETAGEYLAGETDLASAKRLMPVKLDGDIFSAPEYAVDLAAFVAPSGDFRCAYRAAIDKKNGNIGAESSAENSDGVLSDGAIIIDK